MIEQSETSGIPAPNQERIIPKKVGEDLIRDLEDKVLTTDEFDYVVSRLEKDASEEEFKFITEGEKALADEISKSPNAGGVEGKLAQARFADTVGKLKRQFSTGVKVALISAFSFFSQQGVAQNAETKTKANTKKEIKKGNTTNTNIILESQDNSDYALSRFHGEMKKEKEDYITKDGNFRHYHNPKSGWFTSTGQEKVSYAYGATESPYKTLEEMKEKTRIPKSLGETDFFTNYINALSEADDVITDPETGTRYYNYHNTMDSLATGVPFEGDKHWNINRFLIQPHYRDFNNAPSKEKARENALFDMYRYFLYQEKGNREVAWQKANDFMTKEVDSVVESKSEHWLEENMASINGKEFDDGRGMYIPMNLYNSDNTTVFVEKVLRHNGDVLSGAKEGKVYSKKEIQDMLTDYNISFRKKSPEEAALIAKASVDNTEADVKKAVEQTKNKPLTEDKIVFREGVTGFPEGFDSWDPVLQSDWFDTNVVSTQNKFTQEDKDKYVKLFSSWRFAE